MDDSCVILDFDGTILDTEEPVYRSWAELWRAHGEELTPSKWQTVIGTHPSFDPWQELELRLGCQLDPALETRRRARRDALQAPHGPRPGVLRWLKEAEQLGIAVGVASSSPRDWVEGHLRRLGLLHHFACVSCCEGDVPPKPHPASYQIACQRLGADPYLSVAVEDSPHGVTAAVAVGLFTVAVPHRLTAGLDLSRAALTLDSLDLLTPGEAIAIARRSSKSRLSTREVSRL